MKALYCCPNCDRPFWVLWALLAKRFWSWLIQAYRAEPEPREWPELYSAELNTTLRERVSLIREAAYTGRTVYFGYTDADSYTSDRVVDLTDAVSWGGRKGFKGFCHLRQEERSFRSDRVTWMRVKPLAQGAGTALGEPSDG